MSRFCLSLLALASLASAAPAGADPVIAERVQVIYDSAAHEAQRRTVRVLDPHPELGLDFSWEPAAGNRMPLDAEGLASGEGILSWRIPGTPAYDPRALHSRYTGTLVAGLPEGLGLMVLRDGSFQQGRWQSGKLEGDGRWRQADGSDYNGQFRLGLPHGTGVLRRADGSSFAGSFKTGLPDGAGQHFEPGQAPRPVEMRAGAELHPDALLPAQGAGDAARVEVSVVTNGRIALQHDYSYIHRNDGATLHVLPAPSGYGDPDELAKLWEGGGAQENTGFFGYYSTEVARDTRAFLDVTVRTTDGQRVKLDGLELVLDVSAPHLRPLLASRTPTGCVGFRPWLDLVNYGWGPVEAPRLRVSFGQIEYGETDEVFTPQTEWVEIGGTDFAEGMTADFTQALQTLGVDTGILAGNRFTCPNYDKLEQCAQNIRSSVPLGKLAPLAGLEDRSLRVPAQVEISYAWTDAWGARSDLVETFLTRVTLAQLELPQVEAEMGDGGAFAAPAPDYLDVPLPTSASDVAMAIPLRGNPNITSMTANLQLHAEQSSFHAMHFEARLGDGTVQSSMPVWLYYLVPRDTEYHTAARPGACYLPSEF